MGLGEKGHNHLVEEEWFNNSLYSILSHNMYYNMKIICMEKVKNPAKIHGKHN